MSRNYQTLVLPKEGREFTRIPGVFPTDEWFEPIADRIPLVGTRVLDIGCAEGMMAILAMNAGAKSAVAVDNDPVRLATAATNRDAWHLQRNLELVEADAEHYEPSGPFDVIIMSMLLHWFEDPPAAALKYAKRSRKYFVVIFREANDGYQPGAGNWFPTVVELDYLLSDCTRVMLEPLAVQDNGKRILLAIYRTDMKVIGDQVYKQVRANRFWRQRFRILAKNGAPFDILLKLHGNGYVTQLLDGCDLWGDPPFIYSGDPEPYEIDLALRRKIMVLLARAVRSYRRSNLYLSDLSLRNIFISAGEPYLIDFDDIRTLKRDRIAFKYIGLWQDTFDAIDFDYKFDGRLRPLMLALESKL